MSFGSLGSGDIGLLKRLMETLGRLPYRVLVNVGDYESDYIDFAIPANCNIAGWNPQPSVIRKVDVVIHRGRNNTFTECLYFGRPALIMPYVWDGHDNAMRVEETGHGLKMHRSGWSDEQLAGALERLVTDEAMHQRLESTRTHMRAHDGSRKAASPLNDLVLGITPRQS